MSGVKHTLHIEEGANSHFFDGRIMNDEGRCVAFVDLDAPASRIFAAAPDLLEAAEEFCRRVEAGEIRSKRSYAAFKAAIARARGEQSPIQFEKEVGNG